MSISGTECFISSHNVHPALTDLTVSWAPQRSGSHHLLHPPAAEVEQEHHGGPQRHLPSRGPHQPPAHPVCPLRVGNLQGGSQTTVRGHNSEVLPRRLRHREDPSRGRETQTGWSTVLPGTRTPSTPWSTSWAL